MSSINRMLAGVNAIDYSSLQKVSDGTYNKGEIDLQKGVFGKYGFGKINNHVGCYADKNTEVRTAQQNLTTKAAVFKSILTRFAVGEERGQIEKILSFDGEEQELVSQLNKLKNPYVFEAYRFLLGGGNGSPLTRDEMRYLDHLLKDAEEKIKVEGQNQAAISKDEVAAKMGGLYNLRAVKAGFWLADRDAQKEAESWIKGLSVKNISRVTGWRVLDASANARANFDNVAELGGDVIQQDISKYMPELYNACLENVMRVTEYIQHKVTASDILEIVRTLDNGIEDKFASGMKAYRQAGGQRTTRDVTDATYKLIRENLSRVRCEQAEWVNGAGVEKKKKAYKLMNESEQYLFMQVFDTSDCSPFLGLDDDDGQDGALDDELEVGGAEIQSEEDDED